MPLAQTHLYEESEDDVEISAFSESYGLVGSDGYRAWHILNIGDDGDDDVVGDHHGLYHYLTRIILLPFYHFYFYAMLLSHFDLSSYEDENLFFWKDVKHPLHLLSLHDLLAFR